jgi:hypothetical protein
MKKFLILFIIHCSLFIVHCNAQSNFGKIWVTGGGISYKINFTNTGIVNTYLDTMSFS